jgi:hypothetical protein
MLKAVSLVCLLSVSTSDAGQSVSRGFTRSNLCILRDHALIQSPIRIGCEIPQVRLYVVDIGGGYPIEGHEWIALSRNGRVSLLRGLGQLRGLVRITDAPSALRFVRLRTAPATWHMWHGGHSELEVVEGGKQSSLPTFGLRPPYPDGLLTSGWAGIIPPKVYRGIGFGPARIRQAPGGFVITRWTFSDADVGHTSIQKIQESVHADGDYKRTVLARIDPRRVPALRFPTFE